MSRKDFKYMKRIFKGKIKMTLRAMVVFLIVGTISLSMTEEEIKKKAEEFRTEEYYYMGWGEGNNPLDTINAAEAYAQGYTGKGVTLGIVDTYVNLSHSEFRSKDNSYVIGEIPKDIDWLKNDHGTHVAGIMSASKDGKGMHGAAFNSNLASGLFSTSEGLIKAYDYFNTREDIKIINNSWADSIYIDEIHNTDGENYKGRDGFLKIMQKYEDISNNMEVLKSSMKSYNKLLIFGNANSGHITPSLYPLLSYLDKDVKNNIIGVTALDTYSGKDNLGFLAVFSDLNKYNEENSISAPGTMMNSADAVNSQEYIPMVGTSQAAPMITGTGGLVQEAFPYMSGKEIGDVLLSTTSKIIDESQEFAVTMQEGENKPPVLNMIYFTEKPDSKNKLKEDIEGYYDANEDMLRMFYLGWEENGNKENFIRAYMEGNLISIYENVPYEIVYGQGIVNAGKAVKGLGTLNARRLEKEDISSSNNRVKSYLAGKEQALYSINTMGFDSTWSNDISETKAGYMTAEGNLEGVTNINKFTSEEKEKLNGYISKNTSLTDEEKDYFDKMFKFYLSNEYRYDSESGEIVTSPDNDILLSNGKEYIDEYNKRVEESGLAGLSVGLLKEGAGILSLTGNNTYKGASMAGGGTLQIDGSVAGDAYSLSDEMGTGIIAGKGIINGDLYNYGKVQAGSWGSTDILTIKGEFNSTGSIVVNVDGTKNSTLSVESIENIAGTIIEINGIAIPEYVYSGFLVSEKGNTDVENLTGKLSLFLGYDVEQANFLTRDTSASYSLAVNKTAGLNSLSGMNSSEKTSSEALEVMYTALSGRNEQRELDVLYNLKDEGTALKAFQEIYGGLQADMVHNLPLNTRINSSIYSRLSDSDMVLDKAENSIVSLDKNMWIKVLNGWKDIDRSRGMSSVDIDMKGFILGNDFQFNNSYKGGYYLAYGENDIKTGNDKGEIKDFRTGLYGKYEKNKLSLNSYLGLGLQSNESERNMLTIGKKAKGKYDSWILEAGAKVNYEMAKSIYPYGEVNIIRYENENFTEKGAGIYSQRFEKSKNIYTTAGLGIEGIKNYKSGKGVIALGYERVLTGNDPDMRVSFAGNESNKFKIKGHEEDRDYLVMKVKGEKLFENGISIYGELEGRISKNTKDIRTSLGTGYRF